jgi:hypothetical protein
LCVVVVVPPQNSYIVINVDYEDVDDFEDSTATRLSCFAHSLQLCVRDGLKNASYTSRVLGKCQSLAKTSHKSSKIADLLEEIHKHINKMNITRWNSEYLLIKSVLSIGKDDLESISKLMENPIKFSSNDLIVLQEIVDVLEPFYEISVKCQGEMLVTASLVVPAVVHLMVHLRDIKENILFCNKLVQQLESSLEKRFSGIINRLNQSVIESKDPFNDPVYFMAAVLDPSFKFYWLRDLKLPVNDENRLKQSIVQLILDEISKDSTTLSDGNSISMATSLTSSTPKSKRRKLFIYNENNDNHFRDGRVSLSSHLKNPVNFFTAKLLRLTFGSIESAPVWATK